MRWVSKDHLLDVNSEGLSVSLTCQHNLMKKSINFGLQVNRNLLSG